MMQFVRRCTQVLDPVHWPKLRVFVSWLQNRYWGPFTAPQHIWPVPTQLAPVHALQSGRGTLSPEIIGTRPRRRAAFRSNDRILPAGFWNTDLTTCSIWTNENVVCEGVVPVRKLMAHWSICTLSLYSFLGHMLRGCSFTRTVGSLGLTQALMPHYYSTSPIESEWSEVTWWKAWQSLSVHVGYPTNREHVRFQSLTQKIWPQVGLTRHGSVLPPNDLNPVPPTLQTAPTWHKCAE